jgi:hypothetical protein
MSMYCFVTCKFLFFHLSQAISTYGCPSKFPIKRQSKPATKDLVEFVFKRIEVKSKESLDDVESVLDALLLKWYKDADSSPQVNLPTPRLYALLRSSVRT